MPRREVVALPAVVALVLALGACASGPSPAAPQAATGTTPSPAGAPSAAPSPTPTPEPTLAWPTAVSEEDAMHGGFATTAVWVAVATVDDPDGVLGAAAAALGVHGYPVATIPVTCHEGSLHTLGLEGWADGMTGYEALDQEPWGVSVFFRTTSEAQTFVGLWEGGVVGVNPDSSVACDWG
jgi:hypothetical protein